MKNSRLRFSAVLVLTAAVLSSCLPDIDNPPPPGTPAVDPKLIGNWGGTDKAGNGEYQLSVFPRASGWADLVYVSKINSAADKNADIAVYEGYTTTVKDEHYLCFRDRPSEPSGDTTRGPAWHMAHYELAPAGTLAIQIFTDDSLAKLISSAGLKGTVKDDGSSKEVHVTATVKELTEMISRKGWRAFVSDENDAALKFTRARR